MLLDRAHEWLGWPQPQQILNPPGEGARVYADFAKRKIEETLKRAFPNLSVKTGVIAPNPLSVDTSAPLAVVCQFPRGAHPEQLDEAHRLAWNFSRTALLITLEPHRLIAWSCYCDPKQPDNLRRICELPTPGEFMPSGTPEQQNVRDLLHWASLITGHVRRQRPEHFPADGRADSLLLKNLRDVRRRLLNMGLGRSFCHDLLARIIFTQYLFHRRDSDGNAFFSSSLLERRCGGVLREVHSDLGSILRDHGDTYALFRWLDDRFNGDLFPGNDDSTDAERDAAWQAERDAVKPPHLELLADLVSGTIVTSDQQLLLWPQYSFDTIPLEFISSVYEEFLNEDRYKNKAFYTPSHLVDYVLDAVLPWDGTEWNLRILDPACGSGIFLVKAFQRLIHRWRRSHDREPLVRDLKPILANNLIGVDLNPEAVRVASFSLYLAMADAIEPKHYVTREKVFPPLRGTRLIAEDFFDEATPGFGTKDDGRTFDVVIGNAPWGDKSIKKTSTTFTPTNSTKKLTKAEVWATSHGWPVANNDIGPLFFLKSLNLVNDGGRVALVQPAGPWLYHRAEPAMKLRKKLFQTYTVEEVTNLAAIRHELFTDAIGPACILVAGRARPSADLQLFYFAPKPLKIAGPAKDFSIEPQDVSLLSHREAADDPLVWSVLALGGRRDLNLIRKLSEFSTLAKLKASKEVTTRIGVIPGDQRKQLLPTTEFRRRHYFDLPRFPAGVFLELDARQVPLWDNPWVHSKDSVDFEAFKNPQLLIKQSLSVTAGRFRAAIVRSDDPTWGVICKKTYLSVRDSLRDAGRIKTACVVYNSLLAYYFLALTSGRLGHYITEILTKELINVPLPDSPVDLSELNSFEAIDELTRKLFALSQAEWTLVEDLLEFILPDALRKAPGPGRKSTTRRTKGKASEPELSSYAQTFSRVLKSTFGNNKGVATTIFQEPDAKRLPVRLLTVHFDSPARESVSVQPIEADGLMDRLSDFHRNALQRESHSANGKGLGFQRVAFFLHADQAKHGGAKNLTIIKPDECRYWTRSLAMRDADDLSAAILKAAGWAGGQQ